MQTTARKFKILDRAGLKGMLDRGEKFQLWNVLSREYYKPECNIAGSQWVPVETIDRKIKELKLGKSETIVTYCGGFQCPASKQAAEKLVSLGFSNVQAYEGGLEDWTAGGLPLVRI